MKEAAIEFSITLSRELAISKIAPKTLTAIVPRPFSIAIMTNFYSNKRLQTQPFYFHEMRSPLTAIFFF